MSNQYDSPPVIMEVVWDDCLLMTGGWEPHDDVMAMRKRICQRSVGYVLADDEQGVVLAAALSQGGNVFGAHIIPASQIIQRRTLVEDG